jgi:hypothetical protein
MDVRYTVGVNEYKRWGQEMGSRNGVRKRFGAFFASPPPLPIWFHAAVINLF